MSVVDVNGQKYNDGTSCDPSTAICLRVKLISNSKTLTLDTRGTLGSTGVRRRLEIDFSVPCAAGDPVCPGVGLNAADRGLPDTTRTEALLEVLLSSPFPSSGSTTGTAKLWFTKDGFNWRVHWDVVKVKVENGHWDIITDAEFASEVAGLSKLSGKRTKPGDIGNAGFYKIPFKLHACVQAGEPNAATTCH